jgi:hypothetical protein
MRFKTASLNASPTALLASLDSEVVVGRCVVEAAAAAAVVEVEGVPEGLLLTLTGCK